MTTEPNDPLLGRTLDGRYAVEARIARGGMATVYVGHDNRLQRKVAIKVMHGHLVDDENFTRRFDQEARSAARLSHPNVVNVFDQGQDAHMAYLVMEYLPGITLRDLLKQQKRLSVAQASEISEAVLAGLAAAHEAGIVHRDLKPENVLLADDGRIKIGDFGLARAASANTTTGQALLGTIAYLSPELVTRGEADTRSDVYAFGIMLYEMLVGEQPFTGDQPMQIAYKHAHDEMPLPSTATGQSMPELDAIVVWTTQKDPEDRPRTAGEVLRRLLGSGPTAGQASDLAATAVFETGLNNVTPSTTVLDEAEVDALRDEASVVPTAGKRIQKKSAEAAAKPSEALALAAEQRRRFGGAVTAILAIVAIGLGALGWWFGQGPGSLATVPQVAGEKFSEAEAILKESGFTTTRTECSSVDIPVGHVVQTTPRAGARVEPGSAVQLCDSTGPRIIAVPTLVGLSQADAEKALTEAGLKFGEVTAKVFAADPVGIVLAAQDAAGSELPAELPEQTVINLIVSAGPLPEVNGSTVSAATAALSGAGLTVDAAKQVSSFDDEVPEGRVISVAGTTEGLKIGDTVALNVSKGPQLFAVPNVAGKTVRQAMTELSAAGFSPSVDADERYWNALISNGTTPAAGSMQRKGAAITVNYPR